MSEAMTREQYAATMLGLQVGDIPVNKEDAHPLLTPQPHSAILALVQIRAALLVEMQDAVERAALACTAMASADDLAAAIKARGIWPSCDHDAAEKVAFACRDLGDIAGVARIHLYEALFGC